MDRFVRQPLILILILNTTLSTVTADSKKKTIHKMAVTQVTICCAKHKIDVSYIDTVERFKIQIARPKTGR